MFKLVTYDINIIKSAFAGITEVVDEIQIQLDDEGLRLNALDKPHMVFVHLELKSSVFDEYSIHGPLSLNIDTVEFMKVLNRCKPKDILTLESDGDNIIITFEGESTRTFKIRLIDLEYEAPVPPSIDYDFQVELPVTLLKDALSDISVFSDKLHIRREVEDNHIYIDGNNDFGETSTKYELDIIGNAKVDSTYNLEKIKEFMKSEKFSNMITIKSGVNIPLIIEFECNGGVLSYLLAPRIEQNEE